jgi:hypothetical protein
LINFWNKVLPLIWMWIQLALTLVLCGVYFVWVLSWHGYMLMIYKLNNGITFGKCQCTMFKGNISIFFSEVQHQFFNCELITMGIVYPHYWVKHHVKANFKLRLTTFKKSLYSAQNYWAHV